MKQVKILALAVAMALSLGACAGSGGSDNPGTAGTPVDDPVITIENMEFVDGTVTIETGTTVTWVWNDGSMPHNVVFDGFESPLQSEGTYTHTFEEPGTFDYHCAPHPFMKGTVFVVEASGA